MSADITTAPATGTSAITFPRHEQTFPTLTQPEIERMRRFGEPRRYRDGETLFETGKVGPGMFVVLSGTVSITQRDGLGHVTPIIDQGAGQFLAEIGQLSGRLAGEGASVTTTDRHCEEAKPTKQPRGQARWSRVASLRSQ